MDDEHDSPAQGISTLLSLPREVSHRLAPPAVQFKLVTSGVAAAYTAGLLVSGALMSTLKLLGLSEAFFVELEVAAEDSTRCDALIATAPESLRAHLRALMSAAAFLPVAAQCYGIATGRDIDEDCARAEALMVTATRR